LPWSPGARPTVKAELPHDQELIYPAVQQFWDDAIKGSH
jgi:hypothetical protein